MIPNIREKHFVVVDTHKAGFVVASYNNREEAVALCRELNADGYSYACDDRFLIEPVRK